MKKQVIAFAAVAPFLCVSEMYKPGVTWDRNTATNGISVFTGRGVMTFDKDGRLVSIRPRNVDAPKGAVEKQKALKAESERTAKLLDKIESDYPIMFTNRVNHMKEEDPVFYADVMEYRRSCKSGAK